MMILINSKKKEIGLSTFRFVNYVKCLKAVCSLLCATRDVWEVICMKGRKIYVLTSVNIFS